MKIDSSKLFTGLLAAAACLALTAQARAFWVDDGQGGGAQEQLGISEDNTGLAEFQVPEAPAAAGGYAAGTRRLDLTPLQTEQLFTLARYVYGRKTGKHSVTVGHTFSTHEMAVAGNISADGSFQLESVRLRKHDGISDNAEQSYYSEFIVHPDFTADLTVTRRDYYTGAVEIRPLDDAAMAMLMTEISVWIDEGWKWVKYPTPEDLRLKAIEKRAIELEKLHNEQ